MTCKKLLSTAFVALTIGASAVFAQTSETASRITFKNTFSVNNPQSIAKTIVPAAVVTPKAASSGRFSNPKTSKSNVAAQPVVNTKPVVVTKSIVNTTTAKTELTPATFAKNLETSNLKAEENPFKTDKAANARNKKGLKRQTGDDFWRFEFFGGYQLGRTDTGIGDQDFDDFFSGSNNPFGDSFITTNGLNLQATGNFNRYVGVKFDFSATGRSDNAVFPVTTGTTTTNFVIDNEYKVYNFLGGIQVKDNAKEGSRFKPFFHALAGVARQTNDFSGEDFEDVFGDDFDDDTFEVSDTNFALAIGGGLDVRVNRRVDIRVFQVDYNPIFASDEEIDFGDGDVFTSEGGVQNNFRFSFGVVIH